MFALQDTSTSELVLADLETSYLPLHNNTAKFQLNVNLGDSGSRGSGIAGLLEYNTDLFDRVTIQRLASHYLTLLEGIAADPNQRLSELPLLTAAEHAQITGWNDTARSFGDGRSIVDLFEAQAARTPGAVAVIAGGCEASGGGAPASVEKSQRIAFAELNARANQLAR